MWSLAFGISIVLNLFGLVYLLKNIFSSNLNGLSSQMSNLVDFQGKANSPVVLFDIKGTASSRNQKLRQEVRRALHQKDLSSYTRKVFIDFGANDGSSIRYVLDKPAATTGFGGAGQGGEENGALHGLGSDGDWHVFAFEVNKAYTDSLNSLRAEYMDKHLVNNITIYSGIAIGDHNGVVTLHYDTPLKDENGDGIGSAGASIVEAETQSTIHNNTAPVPIMSVSDFFHHHHISKNDFVVVKLDIEGSEFNVLRHMISRNLMHFVNILAVEWHTGGYFLAEEKQKETFLQQQCLNWILGDFPGMKLEAWHRR